MLEQAQRHKVAKVQRKSINFVPQCLSASVPNRKGLTLIEIMVVVAILALMTTGILTVFRGGLLSYRKGTSRALVYSEARAALDMLSREIEKAFLQPFDPNSRFQGTDIGLHFIAPLPPSQTTGDPDLYHIGYYFGDSGTATSAGSDFLQDTSKHWPDTTNKWKGATITIVSGTGAGQVRTITNSTANRVTVSKNWDTPPNSAPEPSVYYIKEKVIKRRAEKSNDATDWDDQSSIPPSYHWLFHSKSWGDPLTDENIADLKFTYYGNFEVIYEPLTGGDGVAWSLKAWGSDDIQVIPYGEPAPPGATIICPGPDGILQTIPGGWPRDAKGIPPGGCPCFDSIGPDEVYGTSDDVLPGKIKITLVMEYEQEREEVNYDTFITVIHIPGSGE